MFSESFVVKGAVVHSVVTGTGAEKAGLRADDVILAYNGEYVHGIIPLRHLILQTEPGTSVRMVILRDSATLDISATVGDRNAGKPCHQAAFANHAPQSFRFQQFKIRLDSLRARLGERKFSSGSSGFVAIPSDTAQVHTSEWRGTIDRHRSRLASEISLFDSCRSQSTYFSDGETSFSHLFRNLAISDRRSLGLVLQSIPAQLAEYFQVPAGENGLLVSEVLKGGDGADAGFRAGDVIISVNGRQITSLLDVIQADTGQGDVITFMIVRDGRVLELNADRHREEIPDEDLN